MRMRGDNPVGGYPYCRAMQPDVQEEKALDRINGKRAEARRTYTALCLVLFVFEWTLYLM